MSDDVMDGATPQENHRRRSGKRRLRDGVFKGFGGHRGPRYLRLALVGLFLLWGPALAFVLLAPPSFTCRWTLILPGAGGMANVSLESIGNASSNTPSPYGGSSLSPTVNYKAIAMSDGVITAAAERLNIEPAQFGVPKITLTDQTSLIDFAVKADNPQLALAKARAFLDAFQDQLSRLRNDEAQRRELGMIQNLRSFKDKLDAASQALLSHQMEHGFLTMEQFKELAVTVERLRQQRSMLVAEQERRAGFAGNLASDLGVSPNAAAMAMVLQSDPLFAKLRTQWADVAAELARLTATMGWKHPDVMTIAEQEKNIRKQLHLRAKEVAGVTDEGILRLISLAPSDPRTTLFQSMLSALAEEKGIRAQAEAVERTILDYERRLDAAGQKISKLDELTRSHQVTEAVFSSAMARLDVGKSDLYVSYPLVQILVDPVEPLKADRLPKLLALAGAFGGSVMLAFALALLWIRMPMLQKLMSIL
ncbi:GumC family protein [Azospirillum baldaniorum]|nr:hypothetical protein [Azospirillum baldaniorum]